MPPPDNLPPTPQSHGTPLIEWTALEYDHHEKGPIWKFLALVCVIGLIVYGILTDSYPFAIVVVLLAGVYFLVHKEPKQIPISLTDMGVVVDHRFYEYANIKNFWIIFKPGEVKTLNLRLIKNVVKEVTILLDTQDPAEIREVLSRFVPELAGRDESFIEWIIRKARL